ncbi:glycosyltransferase family 39 protein [Methanolobus bombayensis]|uniref:glycosyltransferase family 39 protein n=1 Tax=Methanolobus bombayensis TaxID=38023 RepID=UPI001AE883E3|nr:glycosyltransferase family 39 protein [Methanolobus bombayensis]MBP1908200.1 4-amino-4-deoxy-L-arabinose transferase-like glycosyltransferase [Methanolobus bombayensis]
MSSDAYPEKNKEETNSVVSEKKGFISHISNSFSSKIELQIIFAITCLAAVLRIYQLGAESLWLDEVTTYLISSNTLAGIIESTSGDVHPPLYYILVHIFLVAGNSEFALRFPSMLLGVFSVPVLYLLATRLFSHKEGLISSFLLAISLMHIYYSQEARMYSMLMFLSLCSIYFFYLAVEDNKKIYWILFSLFTVLNIYTHYFGFFIFPIEILFYMLTGLSFSRESNIKYPIALKDAGQFRIFTINILTIVLLIIPRIQVFLEQAASRVGGEVTWGIGPSYLIPILFSRFTTYSSSPSLLFLILFVAGAIAVILQNKRQSLLLGMWFILPILVSFYLSSVMPFQPRYLIFILPAFLILVARGIVSIPLLFISETQHSGKKKKEMKKESVNKQIILTILIVLSLVLTSAGSLADYYSTAQKNDWKEVSRVIESNTQQGDVVVALPSYISKPLKHYYDNSSDGTYVKTTGYTHEELDSIVSQTAPNKLFFVLTGDINAANPEGTAISWLQSDAHVISVVGGVYILTPNS